MRSRYVIGNWKMHTLPSEAEVLAREIVEHASVPPASEGGIGVVLCPPFTSLNSVIHTLNGSAISVGAQDCHHLAQGAYTGDVSAQALLELGCSYVILGHSERRRYHLETDIQIGQKIAGATEAGLCPIVCVGETAEQRNADLTFRVVESQVTAITHAAGVDAMNGCIVAYEPIWAIGTGVSATANQAQEVHAFVRSHLLSLGVIDISILYGGSVTSSNASELFASADIDGALVGGASLLASSFVSIVEALAKT